MSERWRAVEGDGGEDMTLRRVGVEEEGSEWWGTAWGEDVRRIEPLQWVGIFAGVVREFCREMKREEEEDERVAQV